MTQEYKKIVQKMKTVYQKFINNMGALELKGYQIVKGQIKEDDQESIEKIQEKIKKVNN